MLLPESCKAAGAPCTHSFAALSAPPCLHRRYKLPFATHLPLSLVSLWLASLAASLRGARPWAVPLTATIAAQLLTCALSAALVYRTESALRAHFLLRSRRAAACLSGGRARRIGLPPAQPAPLAAGGQE